MIEIGEISRLSLSDIWKHEEREFTPWLCEHIDVLSEEVGFSITSPDKEVRMETFRCDIVAFRNDDEEQKVVIENQYGASDHDHLGKLLSYASTKDAKSAIWICEKARTEHVNAINKLNEYSQGECGYYLIEASVIKIEDSKPALVLTTIAAPDVDINAKELPLRKQLRKEFWTELLSVCSQKKLSLYNRVNSSTDSWINAGSGKSGIHYCFTITQNETRVLIVIDKNKDWNKAIFESFKTKQDEIENAFGSKLEWNCSDEQKSCTILKRYHLGGYSTNKVQWPTIINETVDGMLKLEKVFQPLIQKL